jgi:hypothetical protein
MNIPAIETAYKGYRFRSRLEARWAVFFDALGIAWEYEKEGYKLPNKEYYLPDFYLPTIVVRGVRPGVWVEIKGETPSQDECIRCCWLSQVTQRPVFLFWGLPGAVSSDSISGLMYARQIGSEYGDNPINKDLWFDTNISFMQCEKKPTHIILAPPIRMRCSLCDGFTDSDSSDLISAYTTARSARFEFSESRLGVN